MALMHLLLNNITDTSYMMFTSTCVCRYYKAVIYYSYLSTLLTYIMLISWRWQRETHCVLQHHCDKATFWNSLSWIRQAWVITSQSCMCNVITLAYSNFCDSFNSWKGPGWFTRCDKYILMWHPQGHGSQPVTIIWLHLKYNQYCSWRYFSWNMEKDDI